MGVYWGKSLRHTIKPGTSFTIGDGENTFLPALEIKKSESSYSRNVSSQNYPALSARLGWAADPFIAITTPNALGQRNNQYPHVLDGTTWKRWDGSAWQNVQTGLANAQAKILEFNTETKRYSVMVDGTNKKAWDGTSVTDIPDGPATNLYTVDDYRLHALIGSVWKCSAAGSVTDWTTADDADSNAITSMIGPGTAIATHGDNVLCWSEQTMHLLFGNDPYDFEFSDPMNYGCISDRSVITDSKGVLYFLDYGKYMRYTGGRPDEMSQKVRKYLEAINTTYKTKCVAGKHGKYIYLSIPYGSATTNNLTLEYDTETGNWYPIDQGWVDFVNIGEYLYGITSAGVFHKINSGTTAAGSAILWSFITGIWNYGTVSQKKAISDYWLILDLPATSTLTLSYSTTMDGEDFVLLYTFTGTAAEQNTRVQVPTTALQNIDWYRLKFAGTGPCTIYPIEENLRVKSR